MTNEPKKLGRREFISTTAAVGLTIIKPQLVRGTAAELFSPRWDCWVAAERGTAVATALSQHPNARYVALATFSAISSIGANSISTASRPGKATRASIPS